MSSMPPTPGKPDRLPRVRALWSAVPPWAAYLIAAGLVAASLAARVLLGDRLGLTVQYLHFWPAIIVSSLLGGLGPGVLAATLSALGAMYFLLPPDGWVVSGSGDIVALLLFVAVSGAILWMNQRARRMQEQYRVMADSATARAERLDAIVNTTIDGIIVIDAKGTIEAFNRAAEQMFGYPAAEVMGRNVSILMPSPDHERHDGYLAHYLGTGEARIIGIGREVTARRRDGSLFPLHLGVSEMQIGGARKFTGVLHDLTRRTELVDRLGASEARWRAIIDSAVDAIVVIDAFGRIESFNHGAERMFGYMEEAVRGRNIDMLMPSPYKEEHDGYMARYIATGRAKIIGIGREVQGLRSDGTVFPVHLSVGEITIAGQRKFTGILHDLTSRVAIEGQLREQTALARLGEMAAVIAHEVKNPLAGIRGVIQVLARRLPPDDAGAPVLKEIVSRIDALDRMMKDLLMFARTPKPRHEPVDLGPLVHATTELLRQDPAFRDVVIEVRASPVVVVGDAEMLKIVFQNLLLNSAQAMQGTGRIEVVLEASATTGEVTFADSGPGIPDDVRQKIFTPFFTTKSRGSGLGLPTAKRLIEAQHGSIAVDCPASGGTRVAIRLPLNTP